MQSGKLCYPSATRACPAHPPGVPLVFPQYKDQQWQEIDSLQKLQNYTYGGFLEVRNNAIHLGIDINLPTVDKPVLVVAVCNCICINVYKDASRENGWGGRIIFRLNQPYLGCSYLIYGHLGHALLPKVGTKFIKGDPVGYLGTDDSGTWFRHLHVQLITDKFFSMFANDLENLDGYCHDLTEDVSHLVADPTGLCFQN